MKILRLAAIEHWNKHRCLEHSVPATEKRI